MAEERVIYWGSGSAPAWKALVGLEEKQLSYESKIIEFSKGKLRKYPSACDPFPYVMPLPQPLPRMLEC